ncbi:histidine kinase [Neobacillus novalis]|uniref:Histidine kinase n=1 Tax=Neobacillus novalis TaxID=220687 RepID=A0AA95SAQ0_9BACI|nr:histidine kinase [Neobacillus novalis]WHY86037.1 histidine kinase [Neobacillus novalis]
MKPKRITLVIPIMIIVMAVAIWMLNEEFSEIQLGIRLIIAIGAALFSGVISYFLFPENEGKKRS